MAVDESPLVAPEALERAAALLRAGGLVAFPTETVYGLAADARNPAAVRRIFQAKGRPPDHPLIVHLSAAEDLEAWADPVPEAAWRLAEAFWPGPLTLVLPRRAGVIDELTGGQPTVALRVPNHPLALALLRRAGALAAPSANRFGGVSPTRADHVRAELGGAVDMILDGGSCAVGLESTIISLLDEGPRLLRPGGVVAERIEDVLGVPLPRDAGGPRAPGRLAAHYAPATPLELLPRSELWMRAAALMREGLDIAVVALGQAEPEQVPSRGVAFVALPAQADAYGHDLYATLRDLDARRVSRLLVESPPDDTAWLAVRDRLARAAEPSRRTRHDPPTRGSDP